MKTLTRKHFQKLIRDGRIEAVTDEAFGRIEIRWLLTGKRETVNIK